MTYNGFDHDQRMAVVPIQQRAIRDGTLTAPPQCEGCGAHAALVPHLEDYTRPIDGAIWVCRECHTAIHTRHRSTLQWEDYVARCLTRHARSILPAISAGTTFAPDREVRRPLRLF